MGGAEPLLKRIKGKGNMLQVAPSCAKASAGKGYELHLVNVVVMIKIEKSYKLVFLVYFIDQDKRTSYVDTAFVLHRLP